MITIFKRTNPLQGLSLQELYQEFKNNEATIARTEEKCEKDAVVYAELEKIYREYLNYYLTVAKYDTEKSGDYLRFFNQSKEDLNKQVLRLSNHRKVLRALEKRQAKLSKMISKLEAKEQQNNNQPQ